MRATEKAARSQRGTRTRRGDGRRAWGAFFRGLGRAHGPVGGIALGVALGCGAVLLWGRAWGATLDGRIRRGALSAAVLRAATAALSLALVALGVLLAQ